MPWKRTEPMLERLRFVVSVESGEFGFAECCRRFGVSRKTGYKWWARYQVDAAAGLADRARTPGHCPHALDGKVVGSIVEARHAHPTWGPRKLRRRLQLDFPALQWPAISTVGDVLARHGLVKPRRRRSAVPPASAPLAHCRAPNEVWSADFKGQFRLANRQWCYPFTLSDNHSRYLLACCGMRGPLETGVWRSCEAAFREYGLPNAIRTDNGTPFASRALGGLTRLSVWWIKLGIRPERIALGKPQQNGRHERMHRTLKAQATRPACASMRAQQGRFDAFRAEYNHQRPHEALHDDTPDHVYRCSTRPYPRQLPDVHYAPDAQVRRVRRNGVIKWRSDLYFISEVLTGENVGLTQVAEDRWQIRFATLPLAILDERLQRVIRPN